MGNAIQLFTQLARSAARVQTNYALTHMRCEGARTWAGHLSESPSVTELLVDIPHLSLRTAAFCASAVAAEMRGQHVNKGTCFAAGCGGGGGITLGENQCVQREGRECVREGEDPNQVPRAASKQIRTSPFFAS